MTHKTILIQWTGPFDLEDGVHFERGNGLYLVAGLRRYERGEARLQYCGITAGTYASRFQGHHKLPELTRERSVWLGSLVYPATPSRADLELAESLIVYHEQLPLNDKKRVWPPTPTTLISHWHKPDGSPRLRQLAIYQAFPDVISWDGELFRIGNLRPSLTW